MWRHAKCFPRFCSGDQDKTQTGDSCRRRRRSDVTGSHVDCSNEAQGTVCFVPLMDLADLWIMQVIEAMSNTGGIVVFLAYLPIQPFLRNKNIVDDQSAQAVGE